MTFRVGSLMFVQMFLISLPFVRSMNDMTKEWGMVGKWVTARLTETREIGNIAALARKSLISDAMWRDVINGKPVKSKGKRIEICDYLGWTPDSIELILAGGKPKRVAPPPLPDYSKLGKDELAALLEEVAHQLRSPNGGQEKPA